MTDFAKELGDNEQNEIIETQISTYSISDSDNVAVDVQVKTAHSYPRNLKKVLENILFLATQDKDTADNCFYSIKRDGKTIRGASIRLAEIITACYGNIRASSRIVANDGKTVTAQGMCWDLENNVAFSVEVKRRITDKYGRPYSDDLVVISSNACCSIALRNAIFKVVPMAITSRVQSEIKKIVLGEAKDFETTRKSAVDYFINLGVTEKNILVLFDKKTVEELDRDDIFDLRGIATAIIEGDTTLELAFSVAPKTNTAINKASKLLSVPIEQGNAEYEKTNVNKKIPLAVPKFHTTDEKNEIKGVTVPQSLKPNSEFTNIHNEKEVVFGENTETTEGNGENNKTEETIIDKAFEKGYGGIGYTGGNVMVEENIPEVVVTNNENIETLNNTDIEALTLRKYEESDNPVVNEKADNNTTPANILIDKPIVTDFVIDTPVVTEKKEKKVKEVKAQKEGGDNTVKKKYKKYNKKNDTNLFDTNNNDKQ